MIDRRICGPSGVAGDDACAGELIGTGLGNAQKKCDRQPVPTMPNVIMRCAPICVHFVHHLHRYNPVVFVGNGKVGEGSVTGLIFPVQYATATDCRRISLPLSVSTSTRAR